MATTREADQAWRESYVERLTKKRKCILHEQHDLVKAKCEETRKAVEERGASFSALIDQRRRDRDQKRRDLGLCSRCRQKLGGCKLCPECHDYNIKSGHYEQQPSAIENWSNQL